MNKTLYILAENFSNETREAFFEKELPYLCETFKKVYVIPLYPDKTILNFSAPNLEVLNFDFFQSCNRAKTVLQNFGKVFNIFLFEFTKTHNRTFYLKNFKTCINDLTLKIATAKKFENFIKKDINSETVFYSYWYMQWMAALSIIKVDNPSLKMVSRVHGADYDEDQVKRILPFRYFQLSKTDKIFPVSAFAKKYLKNNFSVNDEKIEVSRLGLLLNETPAPINSSELHIVSCSSLIPLKRVELVVDILSNISDKVKWTHFGDGPLLQSVKQKAALLNKPSVICEFKGYVSNKDFLHYLKNNAISIFINVSESEGIPVTLMETIAFGIPVMGPDICGVPEIVTERTGFLIPKDFDSNTIASVISQAHKTGKLYNEEYRNGIQKFYKENFYAPSNHKNLAGKMASL